MKALYLYEESVRLVKSLLSNWIMNSSFWAEKLQELFLCVSTKDPQPEKAMILLSWSKEFIICGVEVFNGDKGFLS